MPRGESTPSAAARYRSHDGAVAPSARAPRLDRSHPVQITNMPAALTTGLPLRRHSKRSRHVTG